MLMTKAKLMEITVTQDSAIVTLSLDGGADIDLPVPREEAADLTRGVGRDVQIAIYLVPTPAEQAATEEYLARINSGRA